MFINGKIPDHIKIVKNYESECDLFIDLVRVWVVGYSDFHNLMGFTSKKMPNNIL
jgi:hypothetical protein